MLSIQVLWEVTVYSSVRSFFTFFLFVIVRSVVQLYLFVLFSFLFCLPKSALKDYTYPTPGSLLYVTQSCAEHGVA